MNCKLLTGTLAFLVVLALVQAHAIGGRGKPEGRGGHGGHSGHGGQSREDSGESREAIEGDRYSWVRNDSGVEIDEKAFVPDGNNVVIVKSRGNRENEIRGASSFYDFNETTPVLAVRSGHHSPCFILDTSLTLEEAVAALAARNDSVVDTATEVALNGTGLPLSEEEADALFDANPNLRRFCGRGPVVVTEPLDEAAGTADPNAPATQDIVFFTLDSRVTLTTLEPERPGRGGHSRGGSRGRGSSEESEEDSSEEDEDDEE